MRCSQDPVFPLTRMSSPTLQQATVSDLAYQGLQTIPKDHLTRGSRSWGGDSSFVHHTPSCMYSPYYLQDLCTPTITTSLPLQILPQAGLTTIVPWAQDSVLFLTKSPCILSASRGSVLAEVFPHHEGACTDLDPAPCDQKCPASRISVAWDQVREAELCHGGRLSST